MSLRVLHVIPSIALAHGGPSVAIRAIAGALAAQDVQVVVATTDDDGAGGHAPVRLGEMIDHDRMQVIFFRRDFLPYKVSFGGARWLQEHVKDFDVVHIHALFSHLSVASARACRRAGVPYVVRPLGVLNRWGVENRRALAKGCSLRFVERPILAHAAALHFTSTQEAQEARRAVPGLAWREAIIPLPVTAPDGGDAGRFRQTFGIGADRRIVLFLSRVDPKKGIEVLIEAFAAVHQAIPHAVLAIAGSGNANYVAALRASADARGIAGHLLWTGHLDAMAKADALAAASVFVLPSASENFGIAAAEALAAGVPCVLSEGVAISQSAAAAEAALVVKPVASDVAAAIKRFLLNPDEARDLADRGSRMARCEFSPEVIGEKLVALYRMVTDTPA